MAASMAALALKLQQQRNKVHGKKKTSGSSNGRVLVTVKIVGSSGPIKFLANEVDIASDVIRKTLRIYRRQRRFPTLRNMHADDFFLYGTDVDTVLISSEAIGSNGCRNFVMFQKKPEEAVKAKTQKIKGHILKNWFKRSFQSMISSH